MTVAGQVRTCQQVELARVNLQRLRAAMPVAMIEPVPYEKVRGLGFYRQFLSTRDWADFMTDGHRAGSEALATLTADRAARAHGEVRRIAIVRIPDVLTRSGKPSNPRRGHTVGAPESDDRPSRGSHTSRRNAAIRSVKR